MSSFIVIGSIVNIVLAFYGIFVLKTIDKKMWVILVQLLVVLIILISTIIYEAYLYLHLAKM